MTKEVGPNHLAQGHRRWKERRKTRRTTPKKYRNNNNNATKRKKEKPRAVRKEGQSLSEYLAYADSKLLPWEHSPVEVEEANWGDIVDILEDEEYAPQDSGHAQHARARAVQEAALTRSKP